MWLRYFTGSAEGRKQRTLTQGAWGMVSCGGTPGASSQSEHLGAGWPEGRRAGVSPPGASVLRGHSCHCSLAVGRILRHQGRCWGSHPLRAVGANAAQCPAATRKEAYSRNTELLAVGSQESLRCGTRPHQYFLYFIEKCDFLQHAQPAMCLKGFSPPQIKLKSLTRYPQHF